MWRRLLRSPAVRRELVRRARLTQARVGALPSRHHEVRTTCHRCGTEVIARAHTRTSANEKLERWLAGHLVGMPCRETLLDHRMRAGPAPLVMLDVDGSQRTYGGRDEALVPDRATTEQL